VALKISKTDDASLSRWNSELRLLKRMADLRCMKSPGKANLVGLVLEFRGDERLPGTRFLATTPLCWGSLERRVQVRDRRVWLYVITSQAFAEQDTIFDAVRSIHSIMAGGAAQSHA